MLLCMMNEFSKSFRRMNFEKEINFIFKTFQPDRHITTIPNTEQNCLKCIIGVALEESEKCCGNWN